MRKAKLHVNPKKCSIEQPQVVYLGYEVSKEGFQLLAGKVEAVKAFSKPDTTSELCCFLGVINYSLDTTTIAEAQDADAELETLKNLALQLMQLRMDRQDIFCGRATARTLARKVVWPGLRKDTIAWAHSCKACQLFKDGCLNQAALGRFTENAVLFNSHRQIHEMAHGSPFAKRASNYSDKGIPGQLGQFVRHSTLHHVRPGAQFESELFIGLAKAIGAQLIHLTLYHPQSNDMVERLHRTLKATLWCCPQSWLDCLLTVMLGLRTAFKEDLEASPAEMLYGTTLRIPGEFLVSESIQVDKSSFVSSLRRLFRAIRPVPASRHSTAHPYVHKDVEKCSHVFKRVDSIKKPLELPYTGPHQVIKRTQNMTYVIEINGAEKVVSVDQLKPAYIEPTEPGYANLTTQQQPPATESPQQNQHQQHAQQQPPASDPPPEATSPESSVHIKDAHKYVTFPPLLAKVTGGEVVVASQTSPPTICHRRKQALVPREDLD
ncbi:uncharacterized protein LOC106644926 [Copidosoma floridanum]|uniref:uncharacterized protein LOC106644926 n=1 Tax=Copidosoma floridanum TaxID=29053 RepID=UPI0006C9C64A|nr:uncharacterized protein LOC106644926 [Copidosoma floridanum]